MSSIRKLKSGRWQVAIRKAGVRELYKTFASKTNAEKWSKDTEVKIERGIFEDYTEAHTTTLKDLITKYVQECVVNQRSRRSTESKYNFLSKQEISLLNLMQLRTKHVVKLKSQLDRRLAPKTVNDYIHLLARVWNCAKRLWSIQMPAQSPFELVPMHKVNNQRDRVLTLSEYENLVQEASKTKATYLSDLIMFAYNTGARLMEIANLKREDVDFNKKLAIFRDTKNGEDRTIPLSNVALEILKRYPFGDNFFRFTYGSFRFYYKQARRRAGLSDFRFHDLRACFCTNALTSGLSIAEVSVITGHKSWSQLKRYTRIKADDLTTKINNVVNIN
jgi:integrase|tara:strand:+ start:567 stop:1565 length:999 start_codon:yes stop_codon:yes gene_type:complete